MVRVEDGKTGPIADFTKLVYAMSTAQMVQVFFQAVKCEHYEKKLEELVDLGKSIVLTGKLNNKQLVKLVNKCEYYQPYHQYKKLFDGFRTLVVQHLDLKVSNYKRKEIMRSDSVGFVQEAVAKAWDFSGEGITELDGIDASYKYESFWDGIAERLRSIIKQSEILGHCGRKEEKLLEMCEKINNAGLWASICKKPRYGFDVFKNISKNRLIPILNASDRHTVWYNAKENCDLNNFWEDLPEGLSGNFFRRALVCWGSENIVPEKLSNEYRMVLYMESFRDDNEDHSKHECLRGWLLNQINFQEFSSPQLYEFFERVPDNCKAYHNGQRTPEYGWATLLKLAEAINLQKLSWKKLLYVFFKMIESEEIREKIIEEIKRRKKR